MTVALCSVAATPGFRLIDGTDINAIVTSLNATIAAVNAGGSGNFTGNFSGNFSGVTGNFSGLLTGGNITTAGDVKAATYHVGATAGIDSTINVGGAGNITVTKGIITAFA